MPTEKYAHAPEILAQCQRIGRQYGLYRARRCSTPTVTELRWNEAGQPLVGATTNRGDRVHGELRYRSWHRAAARAQAAGHSGHRQLQGPFVPHQPLGLRLYGRRSRRARLMERLADKRVAIIGTGATSVQCRAAPGSPPAASSMWCQRTPSSVDVRANAPIDARLVRQEIATPGWQQRWLENFTENQAGGGAAEVDLGPGRLDRSVAPHPRPGSCNCRRDQRTPQQHAGGLRG